MSPSPSWAESLVIVGASVRALAESAARAGYRVHALDLFGDRDLRGVVSSWTSPRPYPDGLPAAVQPLPAGPVIYTGALENHPGIIAAIARGRPLAGCPPEAVAAVRDPAAIADLAERSGLAAPETRGDPLGLPRDGSWLRKPRCSAGGHGIEPWRADTAGEADATGPGGFVWQRRIVGRDAAALFCCGDGRGRLIGASRQLLGRRWCRARPFAYCGSVDLDPAALPPSLIDRLERLGDLLAGRCGLIGFVGVDLVIDRHDTPFVIEINPRPTASLELVDRATGLAIASTQMAAASLGPPPPTPRPRHGTWSKAVLFTDRELAIDERVVAALDAAAADCPTGWPSVADIPCPGQAIPAGRPVCTLFAHGPSPSAALRLLRRRTKHVAAALAAAAAGGIVGAPEPTIERR